MPQMRYAILKHGQHLEFVEMPSAYTYQLTALNQRLHKELEKLTAADVPQLPHVIAECDHLELIGTANKLIHGLDYINSLEQSFAGIQEKSYPLISLLTEIRALQAQLEQWYEEEFEE
ncbi:hydrolase/acyltransferase [Paenibacillus sp. SYP-B3998]|uniref:Hydrolase/acyltransferase n=1 Tax=Paenibacillus sp. SYP-B3998 TaxID=2678564 RepID=A0A6G3ZZV2_9BACL|nr:hydrolase/acyltransferase [Paenibacillus sp. SYP-B3998]NEW07109.1 hydrolase/acyltransferase [Paenibacillus sp. SYP-B3998]